MVKRHMVQGKYEGFVNFTCYTDEFNEVPQHIFVL